MLRQKLNVEGKVERESKIRKRGCSSSSSSSLIPHYRLKRAVFVKKRGGSSTPVPTLMMGSSSKSPPCVLQNAKPMKIPPCKDLSAVSARKLAATLWEINEVVSPRVDENVENGSDTIHGPAAEGFVRSKAGNHRRRKSVISQLGCLVSSHRVGTIEQMVEDPRMYELKERIQTQSSNQIPSVETRLNDVSNGLAAAKELLKVFTRTWVQGEQRSFIKSLVSALRCELDWAHLHTDQAIQEHRSNGYEINSLLKLLAEEKAAWKTREQYRIQNAISSIGGELKVEKKLRRQTERLNKKLVRELADTKALLSKAHDEVESEKRAKEILEQVCDELAKGIEEERDEIEEIKRESAKVREEVEKEREMLQFADVLREERVQMKLSEAKYEFEEKNAAVEKMKSKLEAYLETQIGKENCDGSPSLSKMKELEEYLWKTLGASHQTREKEELKGDVNGEENEGEDSADSDLHSIELNLDNNSKSCYNWSYACDEATQSDSKGNTMVEKTKGSQSVSVKLERNNTCSDRRTLDGIEWDFRLQRSDGLDRGRLLQFISQNMNKDFEDEIERDEMVRDLRDHILSGTRISSSGGFPRAQHV